MQTTGPACSLCTRQIGRCGFAAGMAVARCSGSPLRLILLDICDAMFFSSSLAKVAKTASAGWVFMGLR